MQYKLWERPRSGGVDDIEINVGGDVKVRRDGGERCRQSGREGCWWSGEGAKGYRKNRWML